MLMLDLFSGLGGASAAFLERGHDVVTSDLQARFGCTVTGDIMDSSVQQAIVDLGPYDFVWASPPCEGFSVAAMGHHWTGGAGAYIPATEHAKRSIEIVKSTLALIDHLSPAAWIIENPRGMLRKMDFMLGIERRTVTYCQYGESYMKPTDLWGVFPPLLMMRPMCSNGAPCHESAPRGAKSGLQGVKTAAERAVVPYELSLDVCLALEAIVEADDAL